MSTKLTDLSGKEYEVRPEVLNYDDLRKMAPFLDGHPKLVKHLMHWLEMDEVNRVHSSLSDTPGPEFVRRLVEDDLDLKLRVDNEQQLDHLPQGAFITISNHPYGALDGIILIYLLAKRRPKFRVMVNMILNQLSAMRPNFIAVDAWQSDDPDKRKVSVDGIRQTLKQLKNGDPMGFFPAGAMSKINWKYEQIDREWQPTVLQIIQKAKVPILPIFFHGGNSLWCNILGHVCWPARSLRIPAEIFRRRHTEIHISVGDVISVEEQLKHESTLKEFGDFLRTKTYDLKRSYPK